MIKNLSKIKGCKPLDFGVGTGIIPANIDLLERNILPEVTEEFE